MINHLWIIMDWNRRWAKARFLPSIAGHKAGADNLEKIVSLAQDKGIKYLTAWALSEDNLKKRGEDEVKWIIKIINNLESYLENMINRWLRFDTIGNIDELPEASREVLSRVKNKTKDNTWIVFILALVYGGQDEIIRASKSIIKSWLDPDKLTKDEFRKYTDIWKFPIVDMIVRTGWDIRHSGFMLFDSEYSEYYFTEKKWPDFDEEELYKVIESFDNSKRNFGK